MRFALLGILHVESDDGVVLSLHGLRLRALTALLATRNGEVVTTDEIIDAVWPEDGPTLNAVHVLISKLRPALSTPTTPCRCRRSIAGTCSPPRRTTSTSSDSSGSPRAAPPRSLKAATTTR